MCGEKPPIINAPGTYDGSPPRVRGEEAWEKGRLKWERITPACAGRSSIDRKLLEMAGDHPRVCGEKAFVNSFCVYF